MCALSSSDNVFRLTVKCCCTEPHFYELIRSSAIVQNLGGVHTKVYYFLHFHDYAAPFRPGTQKGSLLSCMWPGIPGSTRICPDLPGYGHQNMGG